MIKNSVNNNIAYDADIRSICKGCGMRRCGVAIDNVQVAKTLQTENKKKMLRTLINKFPEALRFYTGYGMRVVGYVADFAKIWQ